MSTFFCHLPQKQPCRQNHDIVIPQHSQKRFCRRFFAKRSGERFKRGVRLCRITRRVRSAVTTSVRGKKCEPAINHVREEGSHASRPCVTSAALVRRFASDGHVFCRQWQKTHFAARAHRTAVMCITRRSTFRCGTQFAHTCARRDKAHFVGIRLCRMPHFLRQSLLFTKIFS